MRNQLSYLFLLLVITFQLKAQDEPFLNNETYTFDQAVNQYKTLAESYPNNSRYMEFGRSDYGKPVPLFLMSADASLDSSGIQSKNVLLINNAIHPGEPCGVDACIFLAKQWLKQNQIPKNLIIAIIPLYNVGGAHNRGCCSRANQNGPAEYGFRGNARNLDLNRDFIKADSKNTHAFYEIFKWLKPIVFVDTHTSNGADYQHTMTLITSQLDKMNPVLAHYTRNNLNPYLFDNMEKENYPMVPYVLTIKQTPDDGIKDYLETPRYSTGYTNMFNCVSYVTEAHMLKSYQDRVMSTYKFIVHLAKYLSKNDKAIRDIRRMANGFLDEQEYLPINWQLDTLSFDTIPFKGYEAKYLTSEVTGNDRLFYDREQPWQKYIRYYNRYKVTDSVAVPYYYVIPQAWRNVVALLANQPYMEIYTLNQDTVMEVDGYYINDYATVGNPYEGHYLHSNIDVDRVTKPIAYTKGDFIVSTKTLAKRFVVETLEPHAPDSYFAWNYFDAILQQKEWFSGYVFEDEAAEMLKNNKELKKTFEEKKKTDSDFARSDFAQLYYLYKHSNHYERSANFYPITRLNNRIDERMLTRVAR
ncbi:MAG: M14 family zinc carboxypeptidase [Crocinitomicaceae bacterium]